MLKESKKYQLTIELCTGMTCPGIPVTQELMLEIEFNEEEVAHIRQLVKDYSGDKNAGLMPILEDDAPDLYMQINDEAMYQIFSYYLVEGFKEGDFELDPEQQRQLFKKDLESGVFKPEEFIEESMWYEEIPEDEEELIYLWEEWERSQATVDNVAWLRERYPDLWEQLVISEDQDYICHIPEEFLV